MYPPAYPYPQPTYAPPLPHTQKGLGWCLRSFYIYFAALLIQVLLAGLAFGIIGRAIDGDREAIATLLLLLVAGVVTLILLLLVFIFFLIGYAGVFRGRNEFGPTHARNVQYSLYALVAAIVIAFVGGVASAVLGWGAIQFNPFTGDFSIDVDRYAFSLVVGIAFGIASAAMVAALLVLAVRELARPEHRLLLFGAAALGTSTPGIQGAMTLAQLPSILGSGIANPGLMDATVGLPTVVGSALGIVTILLYILAYRGAEGRLRSAELRPIPPTYDPSSWMTTPLVPTQPWGPPPPPPAQPPPP